MNQPEPALQLRADQRLALLDPENYIPPSFIDTALDVWDRFITTRSVRRIYS